MKKIFKPTILKIILTVLLIFIFFGGPILYGRIAISTGNTPETPNFAMNIISYVNYATGIIFYPVQSIFNLFFSKNFINESLSTGTHKSILFLLPIFFIAFIAVEAYLVSCIISYIISIFISKNR